jgi:hypothetical protein
LIFLHEQLTLFKLKSIKEGRPYKMISASEFLETFSQSDFSDQHFLCELYLHEQACLLDIKFNLVPYVGDVQLRAFTYFVNNQEKWWNSFHTIQKNEGEATLWIRGEPHTPVTIFNIHRHLLSSSYKTRKVTELQRFVIDSCVKTINDQTLFALEGRIFRWEASSLALRTKDPYIHDNFTYALSWVPSYIECIHTCGPQWLGMKFHFPLIWMPTKKYQHKYRLTKKTERECWEEVISSRGYKNLEDNDASSYNISNLH